MYTIGKLHEQKHISNSSDALKILERAERDVTPSLIKLGFKIGSLREMCCCDRGKMGKNYGVLGYCVSAQNGRNAQAISLRLREPKTHAFFEYREILGTLCHEICHIRYGNHSAEFYDFLEEVKVMVVESIMQAGNSIQDDDQGSSSTKAPMEAFTGEGKRLGGKRGERESRLDGGSGAVAGRRLGGKHLTKESRVNVLQERMLMASMLSTRCACSLTVGESNESTSSSSRSAMGFQSATSGRSNVVGKRDVLARAAQARSFQSPDTCIIISSPLNDDEEETEKKKEGKPGGQEKRGIGDKGDKESQGGVESLEGGALGKKRKRKEVKDQGDAAVASSAAERPVRDYAAAGASPLKSWICKFCTLENLPLHLCCMACCKPRG